MIENNGVLILAALVVVALVLLVAGLIRRLRPARHEATREGWQRWRGCTRKRSYTSKGAAQVIVARHAQQGDAVNAYECRWCGRWHVGHSR